MIPREVLFATEGRDGAPPWPLRRRPDASTAATRRPSCDTSSDMSAAFIAGIGEHLPNAAMTFDRFHVMANCLRPSTRCAGPRSHRPAAQDDPLGVAEEPANLTDTQQRELTG